MATEKYNNAALTTLNGAINSSTTSVVVQSASLFPTTGQFRILINNEIMLVTGVSSNTFTVTRGAEGTSAASHGDTSNVYGILSAGAVDQIRADIAPSTAWASRPAAEKAGKIFLPTDGFMLSRENGSTWASWGPIFPLTEVVDGNYSWVNQGGATDTTTNGGSVIAAPASGSHSIRARVKSAPATPYKITALMLVAQAPLDFAHAGLLFRNSGSGLLQTFGWSNDTVASSFSFAGGILSVAKWNSPTSPNGYYVISNLNSFATKPVWLRIADDGATRVCSWSLDGINFIQFHAVSRTDFFTADQVGYFTDSANGVGSFVNLLSWLES